MYATLLGKDGRGYKMFNPGEFTDFLIDNDYALEYQEPILEKMREAKLVYILEKESKEWELASRYLRRAMDIAKKESHCYSRQVGAIIANKYGKDIQTGYNGPPRGFPHCEHRHPEGKKECPRRYLARKEGREFKSGENLHLCPAEHAERNAIYFLASYASGDTIYLNDCIPCNDCANAIVQSRILKVVCLSFKEYLNDKNAIQSLDKFYHAGVKLFIFREKELLGCECKNGHKEV